MMVGFRFCRQCASHLLKQGRHFQSFFTVQIVVIVVSVAAVVVSIVVAAMGTIPSPTIATAFAQRFISGCFHYIPDAFSKSFTRRRNIEFRGLQLIQTGTHGFWNKGLSLFNGNALGNDRGTFTQRSAGVIDKSGKLHDKRRTFPCNFDNPGQQKRPF